MSEEIKRFDPIEKAWCGQEMSGTMKEDVEGAWVRYEDLTAANATIAELRDQLRTVSAWSTDRNHLVVELATLKRERDQELQNANAYHADLATARHALETERAAVATLRGELAEALNLYGMVTAALAEAFDLQCMPMQTVRFAADKYASLLTCAQGLAEALQRACPHIIGNRYRAMSLGEEFPDDGSLKQANAALSAFRPFEPKPVKQNE